jgi:hypothetical protein
MASFECASCGDVASDRLDKFFAMQEAFMHELAKRQHDFPKTWPLDLTSKASQIECRDLVFNSMGELFEIVQELKNSKKHRATEVKDLDRPKLIEEAVDAFKFFLELLIFIGVTPKEFFDAYCAKDAINHERLKTGY